MRKIYKTFSYWQVISVLTYLQYANKARMLRLCFVPVLLLAGKNLCTGFA